MNAYLPGPNIFGPDSFFLKKKRRRFKKKFNLQLTCTFFFSRQRLFV